MLTNVDRGSVRFRLFFGVVRERQFREHRSVLLLQRPKALAGTNQPLNHRLRVAGNPLPLPLAVGTAVLKRAVFRRDMDTPVLTLDPVVLAHERSVQQGGDCLHLLPDRFDACLFFS